MPSTPALPPSTDGWGLRTWWNQPSGARELVTLSLPLIVSMISWTIMTFTDRLFLTQHHPASLAAAMPAAMGFWLVICLPLGICQYVNTFVAQYFGANRPEQIGRAVWQGIWLAIMATPLVIATIPFAPSVFAWLADAKNPGAWEIVRQETAYYQILCWAAPAMLLSAAWSSFYTGRGLTRVVMIVDFSAAAANVVLDYLWIFGYGGFPEWGIHGAAWATVISLWLRPAAYAILFLGAGNRREFGTGRGCRWDGELFRRLVRFGFPSGLQMALEVTGCTVFLFLVQRLGTVELAATNLAFSVSQLAFMPVWGISMGVNIMVGQQLGKNRDDLAARAAWTGLGVAELYMVAISLLFVAVPGWFLFGFDSKADPETSAQVRSLTALLLIYVAAYNMFDALQMVFICALRGAGDTFFIMLVSVVMAAALAGGAYAANWIGGGVHAIWLVATVWICLLGVIYVARFLHGKWRAMRVIEPAL